MSGLEKTDKSIDVLNIGF